MVDINLPAFLASTFGARILVANILNSSGNDISIHLTHGLASFKSRRFYYQSRLRNWHIIGINRIIDDALPCESEKDPRFKAIQEPESGNQLIFRTTAHILTETHSKFVLVYV